MSQKVDVTVYIVNRNYENYIIESINSVLKQTYKNYELIIIDDASTDGSKDLIFRFVNYKKIRLIFNKNRKGLVKNCNIAIRAAKGKYVIRLDADDILKKNAVELLYKEISKDKKIGLVFPDYFYINNLGKIIGQQNQNFSNKSKFNSQKVPHGACSIINKNFLFEVGLYDEKIDRQDGYDLWFKFLDYYKISHLRKPLFFYRQHNQNLTKDKKTLLESRYKIFKRNIKKKPNNKKLINCAIIPVRGSSISQSCLSMEKYKGKTLLDIMIQKIIKQKFIKYTIVLTSDKNLLKYLKKKKYKKIKFYERDLEQSLENRNYRDGIIKAVKSHNIKTDNLFILNFQYPLIDEFYYEMALTTLKMHNFDKVISVLPDNETHFYKEDKSGLKIISNSRNKLLKLERDNIFVEAGGIALENYKSFLSKKNKKKIGKIVIDYNSSKKFISNDF